MAIGRRVRHHLGRDVAAGAWPVVDDDRLAQNLFELAREDTSEDVARAARRECEHHGDWAGRIIGCAHGGRDTKQ